MVVLNLIFLFDALYRELDYYKLAHVPKKRTFRNSNINMTT